MAVDTTAIPRPNGGSFFSGFLHPSLLHISPVFDILEYLKDWELNSFCTTDRAAQAIFPHMGMRETYQLSTKEWNRIAERDGPYISFVKLNHLTELCMIPVSMRNQILDVRFRTIGGTVRPEWIPTKLEAFSSDDDNTDGSERYLRGPELPVLPPTLQEFTLGFRMKAGGKSESATEMIKRVLSQTTQLRDVSISVEEGDLIAALPDSVELLRVYMYDSKIGQSWPKSVKHLQVQTDNESEVELEPILPPVDLVTLEMPSEWQYDHYDETMKVVSQMECLELISFGSGIRSSGQDLFASLPRNIKAVKYNASMMLEGSITTDVNSLPDTVEELIWALNNTPVSKWPSQLRIIEILGDAFSQDIGHLPNTVTSIQLPMNYLRPVSKWPTELVELKLGTQFIDIPSIECLPPSLDSLTISLPLARKLMKSGKLPRDLTELILLGRPNRSLPFDLRQLPITLQYLTFDTGNESEAEVNFIGEDERDDLCIDYESLTDDLNEDEMEVNFMILGDSSMSSEMVDPEETEPFIPKREDEWRTPNRVPSAEELKSQAFFYTEPDYYDIFKELKKVHELTYVKDPFGLEKDLPLTELTLFLDRLSQATAQQPIQGISFKGVQSAPIFRAIRDALERGAIVGSFSMIECNAPPPKWQSSATSSVVTSGGTFTFGTPAVPSENKPPSADDDDQALIQLLAALSQSPKITRIKIECPRNLFDLTDDQMKSLKNVETIIPIGLSAFCRSITRMPHLRTLVFRGCYSLGTVPGHMELLVRSILQSSTIENVDLGGNGFFKLGLGLSSVVELIKQTKKLKRLVLSNAEINLTGINQICQAVIENKSLVSLNLAGNPTSLAGLNVIRHALRQNRLIEITVCHLDFGRSGLDVLGPKRHRRLKESRRIFGDGWSKGHDYDIELQ